MAKISQTSITLELETLSCDEVGNGIVMLDITVEEAMELMTLLKERFSDNKIDLMPHPSSTTLEYPPGVRSTRTMINKANDDGSQSDNMWDKDDECEYVLDTHVSAMPNWELEYSNLYNKVGDMMWRIHYEQKTLTSSEITHLWDSLRKNHPNPTKV